jgi:hypothetical protein
MVTDDDRVKILDFGPRSCSTVGRVGRHQDARGALTEVGTVVGTAACMSPSRPRAQGRWTLRRLQLRLVLCEMVTTEAVRRRVTTVGAKILNEDPLPPSRISASVSSELDKSLALCAGSSRRYQTMADLKVALDDIEWNRPGTGPCRLDRGQNRPGAGPRGCGMGCGRRSSARNCRRLRRDENLATGRQCGAASCCSARLAARCQGITVVFR